MAWLDKMLKGCTVESSYLNISMQPKINFESKYTRNFMFTFKFSYISNKFSKFDCGINYFVCKMKFYYYFVIHLLWLLNSSL